MKSAKGMIHSLFVPHWRHVWKLKKITKLEKTSLSDFTLCGAELLHKLPKQLEEHKNSVLPDLQQFIDCLCRLFRHDGKCERKNSVLPALQQFIDCLCRLFRHDGKCERKNSVLPALQQFIDCLCRRWQHDRKCVAEV